MGEVKFFKPRINRRSLAYNFLNLLVGSLASQGISTLILLLTARQLGAEEYGQYTGSLVFTGSTAVLFNLGLDIWLLRNGVVSASLSTLVGSILFIKGILGCFWFLLIQMLLPLYPGSFSNGLIRISAGFVWFNGLLTTVLTVYKLSLKNKLTLFLQSLYVLTWLSFTTMLIIHNEKSSLIYIQARILAISTALITGYIILKSAGLLAPPKVHFIKIILKGAFPFAVSEALGWILMRADTLIIALMLGKREVGIFSTAENVVNALFFIPAAAYDIFVPTLSYLMENDLARARPIVKYSFYLFPSIGILLTLLIWGSASPLVSLLGESFQEVWVLLLILSPIPFLHSLAFGAAAYLVAGERQKQRTVIQVLAAVFNVGMNVVVARSFGINGVGVVYVLTELILSLGYFVLARRLIYQLKVGGI